MIPLPLRFTARDFTEANKEWRANCGPGAFAAITGCTLEQTRFAMCGFEDKGYTNPTLMLDALARASQRFKVTQTSPGGKNFPAYGLARIQFEGPWTDPSTRNKTWRHRHTHWVGSIERAGHIAIFDANAIDDGSTGWQALSDWERDLLSQLIAGHPRASGGWHISYAIEVKPVATDLRMAG